MVAADPKWCQGATTDARKLYYNQDYIDVLDIQQTQFVLAKQALHCALSHFARRQHRIKHRWDLACDFAVNPLLINDGLKAPPETLVDDGYEGMTAEEIYHYIDDLDNENSELNKENQDQADEQNSEQEFTSDDSQQDSQQSSAANTNDDETESLSLAPQPSPLTPQEQEELSIQWQQRLAGAAQQAMQVGKLGGSMARMVDFMLQPKITVANVACTLYDCYCKR